MFEGAKVAIRVEVELNEFFELKVELKQGCVVPPWLFNVFMDGVIKKIQERAVNVEITMRNEGEALEVLVILFSDDAVLWSLDE